MTHSRYLMHFKRRREGKTNYKKRLQLLISKKTRLVVRVTNNQLIAQFISYKQKGDTAIVGVVSGSLEKYGWKNSKNNVPAAYLTGLLLAQKAKEHKIKEAILDSGLQTMRKGGKIYATVKGVVDGGVEIPVDESMFPTDERIKGTHIDAYRKTKIADDFEKTKTKLQTGTPIKKEKTIAKSHETLVQPRTKVHGLVGSVSSRSKPRTAQKHGASTIESDKK